jgi:Protein of unknown function (DUF3638)
MTILGAAALKFEKLDNVSCSLKSLFQLAQTLKMSIDEFQDQLQCMEAEKFDLGGLAADLERPNAFRNPVIHFKTERPVPQTVFTLAEKRARALRNIGMVPLMDDSVAFDVQRLYAWTCSPALRYSERIEDAYLVIGTVETAFWEHAEKGLELDILDEASVAALLLLVNRYRTVVHALLTEFGDSQHRKTELYSRELLVVWIAYCLVFVANRKIYLDILPNMGVALQFQDLEHLVLANKREWSVVHIVKRFLEKYTVAHQELFSLRDQGRATFEMGETLSRSLFCDILYAERQDAERRVVGHWSEVGRKKRIVAQYREELISLQYELTLAKKRREEPTRYCSNEHRRQQENSVNVAHCAVESKKRDIASEQMAPIPVIQPLPHADSIAHRWLFFLYMPDPLRALASIAFAAQQMLVPKPHLLQSDDSIYGVDASKAVSYLTADLPNESITDYYNQHQSSTYSPSSRRGQDGWIQLCGTAMLKDVRPLHIGPDNVDEMQSRDDGVWYPDKWCPRMAWHGGPNEFDWLPDKVEFNPFRVGRDLTMMYFTEQLDPEPSEKSSSFVDEPRENASMVQWAIVQDGERRRDRGNKPIALQDRSSRPSWLTKSEYLLFGKVRSFPLAQVRFVVSSLLNGCLPLNEPNVHKLIFQALFHIGRIAPGCHEERFSFVWKHDIYNGDVVSTLNVIFNHLADRLCETPKDYAQLPLVCELCGFFSAFDPNIKDISRRLAEAATTWAEDGSNTQLKQCILLRCAILCYACGPVMPVDVKEIILLTAKCRNSLHDDTYESHELRHLESMCLDKITRQLPIILNTCSKNPAYLSESVHRAVSTGERLDGLRWTSFTKEDDIATACFECQKADRLFTINIITGVVLVDGLPPTSLPAEILEHALYRRSFGSTNFEILPDSDGGLKTNVLDGKRYRFFMNENDLHVEEIDVATGSILELLNGLSIDAWGMDLPVRLKAMYSHWLSRDDWRVVLRGIHFREKSIHFILDPTMKCSTQSARQVSCYAIPDHQIARPWDELLDQLKEYDRLVVLDPTSSVSRVLGKLERKEFVHVLQNGKRELFIHMPRLRLTFAYRLGSLHCIEKTGYSLAVSQYLRDIMPGFHQYLVLEGWASGRTMKVIIVPDGDVARSHDGVVSVNHVESCDADQPTHCFNLQERFGTLRATNDRAASLRLAAIHAATSLCGIDRLCGMTGAERAAQLIRGCWTNQPLSDAVKTALKNLSRLCEYRHPFLALLCMDLWRCSEQVAFLYVKRNRNAFTAATYDSDYDCDEVTAYIDEREIRGHNVRSLLTPCEQWRILGEELDVVSTPKQGDELEVKIAPVSVEEVEDLEKRVVRVLKKSATSRIEPFPLSIPTNSSTIEGEMYDELKTSWHAHVDISSELLSLEANCKSVLEGVHRDVHKARVKIEDYLKQAVYNTPTDSQHHRHIALDFLRLSNMLPTATTSDFVRAAYHPGWLAGFNPLISKRSLALRESIILWLRLCVLEDKLLRVLDPNAADKSSTLKEVCSHRIWNPAIYPAWLAFEVENGIQIRPEQFVVADHMLKHPGHIVQLNMGLGKVSANL